jgi:glycosyltransferase involved in cell wall biosynthesis
MSQATGVNDPVGPEPTTLPGVTLVINTLNEEANIVACIESARRIADEILVCDMHSDDATVRLAEERGARVIFHPRTGFVEPARKFAISEARHEWVLVLDADERLTPKLAEKLRDLIKQDSCDVVSFWSLFWYFGGWVRHGGFFHGHWRKLFRKRTYLETYSSIEEKVHGNFQSLLKSGRIVFLPHDYYIEHYAYVDIEKYLSKTLGLYARIEGAQYAKSGRRFSLLRLFGEPAKEFLNRFFLKQGFRDGMRGLILTVLYSGYRFCVWANVWFVEQTAERQEDTTRAGSASPAKLREK